VKQGVGIVKKGFGASASSCYTKKTSSEYTRFCWQGYQLSQPSQLSKPSQPYQLFLTKGLRHHRCHCFALWAFI